MTRFDDLRKIRESDGVTGLADYIIKSYEPKTTEKSRTVLHLPTDLKNWLMLKDGRGRKSLSIKVAALMMQDVKAHSKIQSKPTII